jgi:hypothetical protein
VLDILKKFYRKYHNYFSAAFTLIVVSVWLFGPLVWGIVPLEVALSISFAILFLILSLIQDYLDELSKGTTIQIFRNQQSTNYSLQEYIKGNKVKSARFIEYDGESVKPVVIELLEKGASVELLLQHPDHAISQYQRNKIVHQIMTKDKEFLGFESQLSIFYYQDVASVRGRIFDNRMICLGWYTYDRRILEQEAQVWGHTNPTVITLATENSFSDLSDMFNTVFANLKKNSIPFEKMQNTFSNTVINKNETVQ